MNDPQQANEKALADLRLEARELIVAFQACSAYLLQLMHPDKGRASRCADELEDLAATVGRPGRPNEHLLLIANELRGQGRSKAMLRLVKDED